MCCLFPEQINVNIEVSSGELKLDLNVGSYFLLLREALRKVVVSTKSIPLLIQVIQVVLLLILLT